MSFPGISAPTNPLAVVGAGQPVPNSDPPRDEIDRRLNRPARVERPPRVARVTLLTRHTSGGRQPIQRKALITVAARAAASRPGPAPDPESDTPGQVLAFDGPSTGRGDRRQVPWRHRSPSAAPGAWT
jgi:hypothetical protein